MAINLSGKSDASIIASATRAGLASAPKDYGKTFESVTKGYQITMGAQAKMWDEIGKATAIIGKEAIKKAEEFNVSKLYDINATQNYINDALDIKKELQEIGFFRKGFGDAETRQRRMELKSKQKKLFAEAEYVGSAIDNAAKNMANLDFGLMKLEGETVNAIIASNTSNPITTGGNQAKLGRNEKTGRPEWKIFNNGQPALDDITGEPVTMSVDRFKELTTNYIKDVDNVVPTAFNEMATSVLNGGKTFGGDFSDYHKGQVLTSLKNMTNTELGLLRSYKANYMGSSFFEDMTNPSELSAILFNSTLPKTDDDQLAAEGVLANLKDTDGKKGIGQQELINQFSTISGTILSGEPGRKLFEEWVLDKSKKIYDKGTELFKDSSSSSSSSSSSDYKNRNVEFQLQLPGGTNENPLVEKKETTSDNLIYLDKELNKLIASGKSSFDNESYVSIFGYKIGYFPGEGFAPVRIRDDGQLARTQNLKTGIPIGGFLKTPKDVFKRYGIPTNYMNFYVGQIKNIKGGGQARWDGTNWRKIN